MCREAANAFFCIGENQHDKFEKTGSTDSLEDIAIAFRKVIWNTFRWS